jgi:hypothetical protein
VAETVRFLITKASSGSGWGVLLLITSIGIIAKLGKLLSQPVSPTALLGSYLYNRDFQRFFSHGVSAGMDEREASEYALRCADGKWRGLARPAPAPTPKRWYRRSRRGPAERRARDP